MCVVWTGLGKWEVGPKIGGKFDAKIGRRWTLKIGGRLASKTAGTGVENQATHPSSVFIGLRHATHE